MDRLVVKQWLVASAMVVVGCDVDCPPGSVSVERRCVSPEKASELLDAGAQGDGGFASSDGSRNIGDGSGNVGDGSTNGRDGSTVGDASSDGVLANLEISAGELTPPFSPDLLIYNVDVPPWVTVLRVRPELLSGSTALLQDVEIPQGDWSEPIRLAQSTTLAVEVSRGGVSQRYELIVTKRTPRTADLVPINDTGLNVNFGTGIAFSGDGQLLAIGATGDDGRPGNPADRSLSNSGAVFVYDRDEAGEWTFRDYVKAPDAKARDAFGRAVAISLDGNYLAASATPNEITGPKYMAIHFFERGENEWVPTHEFEEQETAALESFGRLSFTADATRLIASSSTRALIFRRTGSRWDIETRFDNKGEISGDGARLALRNDSDNTLELFTRQGTSWLPDAPLFLSSAISTYSLSHDGSTIALGHPDANSNDGAVTVVRFVGNRWMPTPMLFSELSAARVGGLVHVINQGDTVVASSDWTVGALVTFANVGGSWGLADTFAVRDATGTTLSNLAVAPNGIAAAARSTSTSVRVVFLQ